MLSSLGEFILGNTPPPQTDVVALFLTIAAEPAFLRGN